MVSVGPATFTLAEIHFATSRHGNTFWHYIYESSNSHGIAPGNLHWWSRGSKITTPEWGDNGKRNWRACFTRNQAIAMSVRLVAKAKADVKGTLTVTPTLNGSSKVLTSATASFTYPAGASELWVNISPDGTLPDEIGIHDLVLNWSASGSGLRFGGPKRSVHKIYSIYGQPMQPGYDSAAVADTGRNTLTDEGTLTGTRRRLDHFMSLIGGRHKVATQANLVDLYWKVHVGINDTPGAAPFFDAGHDEHLTNDGTGSGTPLDLEDQWLAWVPSKSEVLRGPNPSPPPATIVIDANNHWNDASCIGHAQLAKTMLAAVGLFARRTWVFPHTSRTPDGKTVTFADTDLYCLGSYNPAAKEQSWTFTHNGFPYKANPKLMEPDLAWENFEACMLSPTGKFLTGGYATSSNPPEFRKNKGFNSAAELLRWWSNTSRRGFGKRFMCWIYANKITREYHCWDVDGKHFDIQDYVKIRDKGKQLPPP